jgi:SAM-dependent methyltransferase
MDRKEEILKHATKVNLGLEIAPYHSPIAPKKDGWNCLTLDVFETEKLRALAKDDPSTHVQNNINNIEDVDIVSTATEIREAIGKINKLGQFDYICSSHNFEHLPNPLKFLIECGEVLKLNGYLSMAIPNKRYTFDYARPLSSTKDFFRFYFEKNDRPDPYILFEYEAQFVSMENNVPKYTKSIKNAYENLKNNLIRDIYIDAHVTVYTPESFIQIINDLMILKIIPFAIEDIKISGIEFIVHLKNIGFDSLESLNDELKERRNELTDIAYKN